MWEEDLRKHPVFSGGDPFYDLRFFHSIGSTNDYLKSEAENGAPEGLVAAAEIQTKGRGRSGRNWATAPGEAAAFSILLRPDVRPERVSSVTPLLGLSAARAMRGMTGLPLMIKWPNDIVIGGRKICGILTEAGASNGRINYAVAGIGVNVNTKSFPAELRDRATSLAIEAGRTFSVGDAVGEILLEFRKDYRDFIAEGGDLSFIKNEYDSLLAGRGDTVRIEDPRGPYTAVCVGMDGAGRLEVERDGERILIDAGEVSVRGIYGYI